MSNPIKAEVIDGLGRIDIQVQVEEGGKAHLFVGKDYAQKLCDLLNNWNPDTPPENIPLARELIEAIEDAANRLRRRFPTKKVIAIPRGAVTKAKPQLADSPPFDRAKVERLVECIERYLKTNCIYRDVEFTVKTERLIADLKGESK